jgi:hypothetical protein
MPSSWIVVQVGPVLQVPTAPRFGGRQGWWYIHQRSLAADGVERTNDAWSATAFQHRAFARATMAVQAHRWGLGWRVVRPLVRGEETISLHATREGAELCRLRGTDRVGPALWARDPKESTNVGTS